MLHLFKLIATINLTKVDFHELNSPFDERARGQNFFPITQIVALTFLIMLTVLKKNWRFREIFLSELNSPMFGGEKNFAIGGSPEIYGRARWKLEM